MMFENLQLLGFFKKKRLKKENFFDN